MRIATMKTDLQEVYSIDRKRTVGVGVLLSPDGIGIEFDGHGCNCTEDDSKTGEGHRSVIWIELCNREIIVRIADDINDEEPTTSISLASARFENRED